ncbi:MAG: hypothetical protein ACRDRP_01385 [Pseudonocardiaceae bacterium]
MGHSGAAAHCYRHLGAAVRAGASHGGDSQVSEGAPHAPRLVLLDEVFVGIDKAVTTARFIWTGTALEQADLTDSAPTPAPAGTLFDP